MRRDVNMLAYRHDVNMLACRRETWLHVQSNLCPMQEQDVLCYETPDHPKWMSQAEVTNDGDAKHPTAERGLQASWCLWLQASTSLSA